MSLMRLGKLLMKRRGTRGIREFSKEIGVSPATLSRIERGKMPDLETFAKICTYLRLDPAALLSIPTTPPRPPDPGGVSPNMATAVHFKADSTLDPSAAQDLALLILAAQREAERLTDSDV